MAFWGYFTPGFALRNSEITPGRPQQTIRDAGQTPCPLCNCSSPSFVFFLGVEGVLPNSGYEGQESKNEILFDSCSAGDIRDSSVVFVSLGSPIVVLRRLLGYI